MSTSILRILRPIHRTCLPIIRNNTIKSENSLCGCPIIKQYGYVFIQSRTFFQLPGSNLTQEYSEKKVLGYSMDQFYSLVADVDNYKEFVPWCVKSKVFERSDIHARADLEVGFPPVSEKYTSVITLAKPNYIKSECMDGTLFNYLTCIWKFSKGPRNSVDSCVLDFYVSFEFKSALHSQLANLFFDQVVIKMVAAFEDRARILYGPSSLEKAKKRKLPPKKKPGIRGAPIRPIILRDPSN